MCGRKHDIFNCTIHTKHKYFLCNLDICVCSICNISVLEWMFVRILNFETTLLVFSKKYLHLQLFSSSWTSVLTTDSWLDLLCCRHCQCSVSFLIQMWVLLARAAHCFLFTERLFCLWTIGLVKNKQLKGNGT